MKFSILMSAVVATFSIGAFAQDNMSNGNKMMMDMHKGMADMHMSAMKCMKMGKSMDACHDMMMKDCKMGEEKCKMMMMKMDNEMKMDEGSMMEKSK